MASVAKLLRSRHARFGWLLTIEGIAEAFSSIPELVGSGEGSWIGTDYGPRSVKLGLVMPSDLSFGYTWVSGGKLEEGGGAFQLLDFDGTVVDLFREEEPDEDTETLVARLAPSDDPAPEEILGPLGTPIPLWDRHVGLERIGPAGERRFLWCWPDDAPNGFDHPAGIGWPTLLITQRATMWPGRKISLWMIVYDPETATWPSWQQQYEGGALAWYGEIRGYGAWRSVTHRGAETRALDLHVAGPTAWIQGAINTTRPPAWRSISGAVEISEAKGNHLVACWMGSSSFNQGGFGEGGYIHSVWDVQTFASGNTLAGITSRQELADKLNNIANAMISGLDWGDVLGSSNTVADPPQVWQAEAENERSVSVSDGGSLIKIRRESSNDEATFSLVLHADVWAAMGWDLGAQRFESIDELWSGAIPVGGEAWGEAAGANKVPTTGYYRGWFSTMGAAPGYLPDNGGSTRVHTALWPEGTVIIKSTGGDILQLGIGDVPCEGQLADPPKLGTQIDGQQCDASGWWIVRGKRLTREAYEAGEDPVDFMQVALCDWVATDDRLHIAIDSASRAAVRVRRWENPRRFGVPHDKFSGTWAAVSRTLEMAPIAVIGGTSSEALDRAYWLPTRLLLSSGTAYRDPLSGSTQPGEQHPLDQEPADKLAGDLEVRDLSAGLPRIAVDHASWRRAAGKLPGGRAGALARSMPVLLGPGQIDEILHNICTMRGWVLTWRRQASAPVPAYGVLDPIATLSPDAVEVTITDAVKAAPNVAPELWRPAIKLREAGPYDQFDVQVDRNPVDGNTKDNFQYSMSIGSLDSGRRFRSGRLHLAVADGGLRDPGPWIGTPLRPLYDWTDQARQRLGGIAGPWWARSAWLYTAIVDATVAPDLWLGTIVRVIDPRAATPQGAFGVDHIGYVAEIRLLTREMPGAKQVTIALQPRAVSQMRVWGPSARVLAWDAGTSTATISEDWAGAKRRKPSHDDTLGFTKPPWCLVSGGPLKVQIFQSETGRTYPDAYTVTADVLAADAEAHTLTLDNVVGKIYRDMIKWIVAAPWADQPDWARSIYVPITDAEGYYAPGQKGRRLK